MKTTAALVTVALYAFLAWAAPIYGAAVAYAQIDAQPDPNCIMWEAN